MTSQIEVKYRKHGEYVVKFKGNPTVVGRINPDENGKFRYTPEGSKEKGEAFDTLAQCVHSLEG